MAGPGGTKRSGGEKPEGSSKALKTAIGDSSPEDTTWQPKSGMGRSTLDTSKAPQPKGVSSEKAGKMQMGGAVTEKYSDSQPTVDKGTFSKPPMYDHPQPQKVGSTKKS